jgi:hypothetical protein
MFCRRFGTLFIFIFIQPLKMDLTEGSETSAKHNLTPEKHPKEHIQDSEHGENLKSRTFMTSPKVQTGSDAHPASYSLITTGLFPGD